MALVTKTVSDIQLDPDSVAGRDAAASRPALEAALAAAEREVIPAREAVAKAQADLDALPQTDSAARLVAQGVLDDKKAALRSKENAVNAAKQALQPFSPVDIRVASVSFSSVSGNAMVHRPRIGAAQAVEGHLTASTVSIAADVDRHLVEQLAAMAGRSVYARFVNGGSARGVLTQVDVTGDPATWQAAEPYVAVSLSIVTTRQTVRRED